MSVELIIENKEGETALVRCGATVVKIERGEKKTIVYHGKGQVEIHEMPK